MPRRFANLVLLAAITTLLVSGIVAWLLPDTAAGILYVTHRVAGVTLVLALLAASFVVTVALDRVALARRGSGSRHAGSFTGNAFPMTIWSLDSVPTVDVDSWRLRVSGSASARPIELSYADLGALPRREASVVLDCT